METEKPGCWKGEEGCCHYNGVLQVIIRTCCGGKRQERVKLACAVHNKIYAEYCREQLCGNYERSHGDVGGKS